MGEDQAGGKNYVDFQESDGKARTKVFSFADFELVTRAGDSLYVRSRERNVSLSPDKKLNKY